MQTICLILLQVKVRFLVNIRSTKSEPAVGSSLPPSSPPQPFSDFDDIDEEPLIANEIPDLEEDEEGEGN